jgi:hypothetical protein
MGRTFVNDAISRTSLPLCPSVQGFPDLIAMRKPGYEKKRETGIPARREASPRFRVTLAKFAKFEPAKTL